MPEIMTPLADAVRLVNDEALQQILGVDVGKQPLQRFRSFEFLGRDVKELDYVAIALASNAAQLPVPVTRAALRAKCIYGDKCMHGDKCIYIW